MPKQLLQERVAEVLKDQGIKPVELRSIAGVSKGLVSQWMNGQAKTMGYPAAKRINARYGYSVDWLTNGDGQKLVNGEKKSPLQIVVEGKDEIALIDDYRRCSHLWKFTLRLLARAAPTDQQALTRDFNILMTTVFGRDAKDLHPISDERMEDILSKSPESFPPRKPTAPAKRRTRA